MTHSSHPLFFRSATNLIPAKKSGTTNALLVIIIVLLLVIIVAIAVLVPLFILKDDDGKSSLFTRFYNACNHIRQVNS